MVNTDLGVPGIVLVYICCPCMVINSANFIPKVSQYGWLLEDTGYKGSLWLSSFPKHDNWKLIASTRCSLCSSCLVCSSCLFLPWRPLMLGSTPPSLTLLLASYPWFGRSVCSSSIWGRKKRKAWRISKLAVLLSLTIHVSPAPPSCSHLSVPGIIAILYCSVVYPSVSDSALCPNIHCQL